MNNAKIIMTALLLTTVAVIAEAQQGLTINRLFDGRYHLNKNATEIVVSGAKAETLQLSIYHSLTITGDNATAEPIEKMVNRDGADAVNKEVEYRDGRVYYGLYSLKPYQPVNKSGKDKSSSFNRFIFYLNQNLAKKRQKKIILIYMESERGEDYIKTLIRK